MRFLKIILISLVVLWAGPLTNLAVLDLQASSNITADEARMISDRLESELSNTGSFTILERRQMQQILVEQGFQQSGACDGSQCQIQMGQLLGVDKIVTGSVGRVGDVYTLNTKLISVGTGVIEKTQVVDIKGGLEQILTEACHQVAAGFAGSPLTAEPQSHSHKWLWIGGAVAGAAAVGGGLYAILSGTPQQSTVTVQRTRAIQ